MSRNFRKKKENLDLNFAKTSIADGHFTGLILKKKKQETDYKTPRVLSSNTSTYREI